MLNMRRVRSILVIAFVMLVAPALLVLPLGKINWVFASYGPQPPISGSLYITCASVNLYDTPAGSILLDSNNQPLRVLVGQTFPTVGNPVADSTGKLWVSIFIGSANYPYVPLACTSLTGTGGLPTVGENGALSLPLSVKWPDGSQNTTVKLTVSHGDLTINSHLASVLSQQVAASMNDYSGDEARLNLLAPLNAAVVITGDGTSSLTISGTGNDVNVVLASTVYQPSAGFVGVDQVVIAANSPANSFSSVTVEQIVVVSNSANLNTGGAGPTGSHPVVPAVPAPNYTVSTSGPATLYVLPNTVTNGTVATMVMAQNSVLTVPAEQFGSNNLVNQGIISAIDVFGITAGGNGVVSFNAPVKVCLQGFGHLFFLNASGSPRTPAALGAFVSNGATCGTIGGPGTLVLTAR